MPFVFKTLTFNIYVLFSGKREMEIFQKQKNTVTLYLILLGFLCMECMEAGLVKTCPNCTDAQEKEGNITGLYIAAREDLSILCSSTIELHFHDDMLQFANSSTNFYRINDSDRVQLHLSYSGLYKHECENGTYLQQGSRYMPFVTSLKLSNSIKQLYNFSFSNFHGLRKLNLSHNFIRQIPFHAFCNLSKLEVLDLSFNSLTSIDASYLLSSLSFSTSSERISSISLASNFIKDINCSIFDRDEFAATSNSNFYNLSTEFDISNNDISYIPDNCKAVITNNFRNVTLKIDGKFVVCNCSTKHDSSSDSATADFHDCTCQNEKNRNIFNFIMQLQMISSEFLFYFSLSFSVVVFIAVVFAQFRRARLLSLCNGSYCTNSIKNIQDLYRGKQRREVGTYVYIVASQKDANILGTFVEELETRRNIPVIFKERDEIPGYFKIELFRKWLSFSKRTIFLISSNFFEDTDCANILTQARAVEHTQSRVIIIIIKISESIPPDVMQSLQQLCMHGFYLDYNTNSMGTPEFWDRLVKIIHDSEMHVHVTDI